MEIETQGPGGNKDNDGTSNRISGTAYGFELKRTLVTLEINTAN
jgi:hypothetical protein